MSNEMLAKLIALRNTVQRALDVSSPRKRVRPQRAFDPKENKNLFSRFDTILEKLISGHPSLFDDFPVRDLEISGTTEFNGRGFIERRRIILLLNDIENCIDLLSGLPKVEIPSMKVTREGVFFAGQYFDALKNVRDIFSNAQKSIVIIDGYIDGQVLDILTLKDPNVKVEILTKKVPPALTIAAQRFNKQYGRLSIKTSSAFHDRFVIIDDIEYYHFGASIKDLGNRGFMFSRIEEPSVIKLFSTSWSKEWKAAKNEI